VGRIHAANLGIEGLRVLQGLLALANRHTGMEVDQAYSHCAFHLRTLRQLLKRRGPTQGPLPFLDEHPIIRPMADYSSWLRSALASRGGKKPAGSPGSFPRTPSLLALFSVPMTFHLTQGNFDERFFANNPAPTAARPFKTGECANRVGQHWLAENWPVKAAKSEPPFRCRLPVVTIRRKIQPSWLVLKCRCASQCLNAQ
jgi:hypothetical protein